MRARLIVASFSLFVLTAANAEAGGYLTARYGSEMGSPAMPNAYAIYYNPGALGGADGTTITVDSSLLFRIASYRRTDDALSPANTPIGDLSYRAANTGTATHTAIAPLPYLAFNTDFGKKLHGLHLGYALYVPYGGAAAWNKVANAPDNVPGAVDGPQRWHDISGQIVAVYNTLALAYALPARFSIGVSFSPVLHLVKDTRARNLDGSDDTLTPTGKLIEGRAYLNATGFNVGLAAGLYWDPLDDHSLKLGLSYTSQPGFGDTSMSGDLTQISGFAPAANAKSTKVDFIQSYPDIIRFGFSWQAAKKWEIHSDFSYQRWSVMKHQCIVKAGKACNVDPKTGADPSMGDVVLNIPANWKDAIEARFGGIFSPLDNLGLYAMTGFGTSAVPASTINAATLDGFRINATVGAQLKLGTHWTLGGSYNHVFFLDVDTKATSSLYTYAEPSKSPSANGVYKQTVGFIGANAAYTF